MSSKPINENYVFETYRSSYRERFDWSATIKDNLRQWLSTFESSTYYPKTLVTSSLFSMTGSLCGPSTTVCSNNTFSTTLYTNSSKKVAVTGLWPTFLLMNVFIALKGSHFWFLFDFTAAGVVPCGGRKTSPRTSTIVQFIFYTGPLRSAIIFWEIRNKWLV